MFKRIKTKIFLVLVTGLLGVSFAQSELSLDEIEQDEALLKDSMDNNATNLDLSELEEVDDLESLKNDIGDVYLDSDENESPSVQRQENTLNLRSRQERSSKEASQESENAGEIIAESDPSSSDDGPEIFDVGKEEQNILNLSRYVEGKIPANEWDEIADSSRLDKYVVQKGDWLWKISQQLFGTGFYYSKIWSLNPHITNPHEIEPGMTLLFDSGSASDMPEFRLGEFQESNDSSSGSDSRSSDSGSMKLSHFGDDVNPNWLQERQKLIDQGVFFQYASEETYDDLSKLGKLSLNQEYKRYSPPATEILIKEPGSVYDELGFDKNSKISFDVKDGFYLNTFVTNNIVEDLGQVMASPTERVFLQEYDRVYVEFGPSVRVKPGDKFSVYSADGKVAHPISEREGFRYTILAQVEVVKKINDLWECEIVESTGTIERGQRLTVYTPRIEQIVQTFNPRNIEAAIVDSFRPTANGMSFGDVVYLDRGRADGVEMGNIFELYSFMDKGTGRRITVDPTYKIGEVTVITLTDNYSTALVSRSTNVIPLGTVGISKNTDQAALASKMRGGKKLNQVDSLESGALDELDVELNLDDYSRDLLEKADSIELTEDELAELERQERERSIIGDHERDLRELERLESEIIEAETSLSETKVDEDKFLEQHDLDKLEGKIEEPDADAFHSLNEIESDIGRKYLEEDLNERENPYGLSEYDLEEIDELLNSKSSE